MKRLLLPWLLAVVVLCACTAGPPVAPDPRSVPQRVEPPPTPAKEVELGTRGDEVVATAARELKELGGQAGAGLDLDPDRPFVDRPRRRA